MYGCTDLGSTRGSLKLGWVTASLIIQKLQAFPRKNVITRALQEYGRLIKTIFILKWYEDEAYRRRISRQLNKGEALHSLRSYLSVANQGIIRRKDSDGVSNQVSCLNLVTNAVITWNTVYMNAVIQQLKKGAVRLSKAMFAIYGQLVLSTSIFMESTASIRKNLMREMGFDRYDSP